jgi:hypothetical protein
VLVNSDLEDKKRIKEEKEERETRHNMFIVSLI